jgi:hypothetical protein
MTSMGRWTPNQMRCKVSLVVRTDSCSTNESRRFTYNALSTKLSSISNEELARLLLVAGKPLGISIGGAAFELEISGIPVFIKKIRLTDIEGRLENKLSTVNLFNLPARLHYGVGSIAAPQISGWRELSAHMMCTNWVLAEECPNFPLLYHWRVLPEPKPLPVPKEHRDIERVVDYWGESLAIRSRLEAERTASASIVLFVERFPATLWDWLNDQISKGGEVARLAVQRVESELRSAISFMGSREMIHFDAHFRNILTDGKHLYFTDFGLAASKHFILSDEEKQFFDSHRNYDLHYALTCLTHRVLSVRFGADEGDRILQDAVTRIASLRLEAWEEDLILQCAQVAVLMKNFIQQFQENSRTTLYSSSLA